MGKKLDIVFEIQEPRRENNTILEFYITSGKITVSSEEEDFTPSFFVNGKKYGEDFLEKLRVVIDSRKENWPEYLPFRLIWDEDGKTLKGIKAYYDFLIFKNNGYYPEDGLSVEESMKQVVHFELD